MCSCYIKFFIPLKPGQSPCTETNASVAGYPSGQHSCSFHGSRLLASDATGCIHGAGKGTHFSGLSLCEVLLATVCFLSALVEQ